MGFPLLDVSLVQQAEDFLCQSVFLKCLAERLGQLPDDIYMESEYLRLFAESLGQLDLDLFFQYKDFFYYPDS